MNLIGKAADPKFWSETVKNNECYKEYVEERNNDWNKYCENKPILELSYNAFKQFTLTGERKCFEDPYFTRRAQLATSAVMSLIYPEEQKYIDYLQDIIFAICDEYTWSVSAHHPNIEVYDKTFIDLFASETGFALSEIYTMLGDRLDPLIRKRIKVEVKERIIDSFLSDRHFWWAQRCTHNWAAVCGGSVGCTFMLMYPELFETVKPRLDNIMESFLSGFKDDGYCLEGTGYWHYGFGFFITYADMLKAYTEGKEDYFTRPKIKNIASFIQKMFLSGKCSVSFADGDSTFKYHLGTVHYLKKLYPDDVKVYSPEFSYNRDGCSRFCLLIRSAVWRDEYIYNNPEPNDSIAEYYADGARWYIKRAKNYGFAAKGGHNNEPHNHNDIGTFIFAKDGKQIIGDMGRGAYTKQYFRNETRYLHIECSSLGHNVPHFGDEGVQKRGGEFSSKNEVFEPGKFEIDIAGAYGDENIKSIKRRFETFDDEVKIKDSIEYCGDADIYERIISVYPPELLDSSIKIESGEVIFDKNVCEVSITEKVTTKNFTVYLIDFKLNKGVNEFELTVR